MALIWARTSLIRDFWDVVQAVGSWSGAKIIQDRKGLRLTLNHEELGQLNWGGQLIMGFAPIARNAIVAEKMARVDPDQPDAHRVLIDIRNASDVNRALTLLRLAYLTLDSAPNELSRPAAISCIRGMHVGHPSSSMPTSFVPAFGAVYFTRLNRKCDNKQLLPGNQENKPSHVDRHSWQRNWNFNGGLFQG
jgi:hypothetical protein